MWERCDERITVKADDIPFVETINLSLVPWHYVRQIFITFARDWIGPNQNHNSWIKI